MPEQRSPLKEFRHLEEKLKTVGLSPAERARLDELRDTVASEAAAPRGGFDVNAAAEALKASLEPAGPRRSAATPAPFDFDAGPASGAGEAAPALDPGSGSLDPGQAGEGAAPAWEPAAAGSDDQEVWDAGAARPPLDRASAFDLDAPPFDAAEPGEPEAGTRSAAATGDDPGLRPDDLGPAAFDAAGLPPEPGPGAYDQGGWDTGGAPPLELTEAGPAPEAGPGEPAPGEPELVEAELIEPEPAEAPAAAEETYQVPEEFEPAPIGGPGASQPGGPPAPSAPPAAGMRPGTGEARPEELPPFELAVEEVVVVEEPPVPAPAAPPVAPRAPAPPAPARDAGGPSPTLVVGEHRVVVHTLEGQVLRGTIADVDLDAGSVPLVRSPGAAPEPLPASKVKAIFFMLPPGERLPPPEGHRVRVTFRDGRQVAGFSSDYDPEAVGFFVVPAESRTNTGRIWVYRAAVRQVSVS